MAVYTNAGGGAGAASDECTAAKAQVLAGYTAVTSDSGDEPAQGTMANHGAVSQTLNCGGSYTIPAGYHNGGGLISANSLAAQTPATATAAQILSGYTAWINGGQITGTMTVNSVVSFSVAAYSATQITVTWQWPWAGPYSGVAVQYKEGGYPTTAWDGIRGYTGIGSSYALGSTSSVIIGGLNPSTTYYFRIWVYCNTSLGDIFSTGYREGVAVTRPRGIQTITASGIFTVPANVYSIDVFVVGGGSNGCSYWSSATLSNFGAGGGSGYTATQKAIAVSPGQQFNVTVGAGATPTYNISTTLAGGASSFGGIVSANGGAAYDVNSNPYGSGARGGKGGSGGAGGGGSRSGYTMLKTPTGGIDGSAGENGILVYNYDNSTTITTGPGGPGQGFTTRAFGENWNTLYASGGNGAASHSDTFVDGTANTGNGGTGSGKGTPYGRGGYGGSGVVLVRWGY